MPRASVSPLPPRESTPVAPCALRPTVGRMDERNAEDQPLNQDDPVGGDETTEEQLEADNPVEEDTLETLDPDNPPA